MIFKSQLNKNKTKKQIALMEADEIKAELQARKIKYGEDDDLETLKTLLLSHVVTPRAPVKPKQVPEDETARELNYMRAEVAEKGEKLNNALAKANTPEEAKVALTAALGDEDLTKVFLNEVFPQSKGEFTMAPEGGIDFRSATPRVMTGERLSEIIKSLPMRIFEQKVLEHQLPTYPFSNVTLTRLVRNGTFEIVYHDYRPAGERAGYDPVIMKDLNPGSYDK